MRSSGKQGLRLSSARNAAQPTCSGLKVCLSSGRFGSAETAGIAGHLYWKMVTSPLNFKKNGEKRRLRIDRKKGGVRVYSVARYFRWKGLITFPFFRSALKVWLSTIQSDSSESCVLMNSA